MRITAGNVHKDYLCYILGFVLLHMAEYPLTCNQPAVMLLSFPENSMQLSPLHIGASTQMGLYQCIQHCTCLSSSLSRYMFLTAQLSLLFGLQSSHIVKKRITAVDSILLMSVNEQCTCMYVKWQQHSDVYCTFT